MKLDRLILIHKTHLDVGFTDLAANVRRQYMERFIPAAIDRAEAMNAGGEEPGFIWTTGAWIIWKALECGPPEARRSLERAILKGWVTWHALPFTFHTELLNPALLRLSLKFGQELDQRFGRTTLSAKMTDVPGHTMGLVPILAEAGVEFLHIGVNPASKVPAVPPVFRWSCQGREVVVAYSSTYGDVSAVPGVSTGLTFLHTNDNMGPPREKEIRANEDWLKARYDLRQVRAGTMDEFAGLLRGSREALPVMDMEIGDSWIHGAGSDPRKLSEYCAMRRDIARRAEAYLDKPLSAIAGWLEPLLLIPEHTWGLDVKAWFGEHRMLSGADLQALQRSRRVRQLEASWEEQRAYVETAMDELPLLRPAVAARRQLRTPPFLACGEDFSIAEPLVAGRWLVRFEPATGCVSDIFDRHSQLALSPANGRMNWGLLRYEQVGRQDYQRFLNDYMGDPPRPWWAEEDFKKWGLDLETRETATLRCGSAVVQRGAESTSVLIRLQLMGESQLLEGSPADPWLLWTFPHEAARLDLTMGWSHKAPTGAPEALWLGFRMPEDLRRFSMKKLGVWVDPENVVSGGGASLHAIDEQVRAHLPGDRVLTITSEDAPLFSPGRGQLLPAGTVPAPGRTVWFNLFNNLWNTNFPQWNSGAMAYHFRFEV